MISGIYKILNVITGDFYIGSAKSIKDRWWRHKKDLRGNRHHSVYMQRSFNKYGEIAFIFGVIEYCEKENLEDRENYHLSKGKPTYNSCPVANTNLGRKLSDENKQKYREIAIRLGHRPPKETYEQRYLGVTMLDYNTLEPIKEFKSLSEACFHIGKNYTFVSTIALAARGDRKSAFGYKWKMKTTLNIIDDTELIQES